MKIAGTILFGGLSFWSDVRFSDSCSSCGCRYTAFRWGQREKTLSDEVPDLNPWVQVVTREIGSLSIVARLPVAAITSAL